MHTTKGTHIDFPKKRLTREVIAFALITLFLHAFVCTTQQILAQGSEQGYAFDMIRFELVDSDLGIMWHPGSRTWLISGIQRSFGLKELDEPWISAGMTHSHYSIALGANTIGWEHMRQWVIASSTQYAKNDLRVTLGSEFLMLRLRHPYRNDTALTLRADLQKTIINELFATVRIQNILGSGWHLGGDPIERKLQLTLNSVVHPDVLISGGFGVSDQFPADYQSDVFWSPNSSLVFRFGVGTEPSRIVMGISVDNRGWVAGSGFNKITNSQIGWRQNYWMGRKST